MVRISLMVHTASCDNFMHRQGIPSYFNALARTLARQTFSDFELIYIDSFYEDNKDTFAAYASTVPFIVKHVPVHPAHRYWYDRNNCYISAAKNTGILYADGELLVTCDDAEFLPANMLELYWKHYKETGRYMHAVHKRMRSIETDDGVPRVPLAGDFYVNDHRWQYLGDTRNKPYFHRHGSMCYAGSSFSLADALNLNGFNERMDGCKSLEDCDFGNRLAWLGRSFVMDPQGWLAIVDHPNYSEMATTIADGQETIHEPLQMTRKNITNFIAVENYGMLRCAIELMDPIANKNPLTARHIEIIKRDTLKYRQFDPTDAEHIEAFNIWQAVPTFNLRAQWNDLRNSKDWRW